MRFVSRRPAVPDHRPIRVLYSVKAISLSCALFTLSLLAPTAARAQYSVTYSGGHWIDSNNAIHDDGPVSGPTFPGSWGVGVGIPATIGGGTAAVHNGGTADAVHGGPHPMDADSNTISAYGAMTAHAHCSTTLPAAALEEEICIVSWSGASGDCYNPYGGTKVSHPTGSGQTQAYIRYTFLSNPNADIYSSCDAPTATATADASSGASISVQYRLAIYPVEINFSGTTMDPNDESENILIGQHCQPDLLADATQSTQSDWQWSVGGETFQTWSPTTPAIGGNPANSQASYYVDGPGPLNIQNPSWYWNDLHQTTETVSCTAQVTPPNNWGPPCAVTASNTVTVWRPNWTATGYGGYVKIGSFSPGGPLEIFAGPTSSMASAGLYDGMNLTATVTSPNTSLFGDGSIQLVQLVTPNLRYMTPLGISHTPPDNDQQGLDNTCPYPWKTVGPPVYTSGDSPGIAISDSATAYVEMNPQFETFLMFAPPGAGQYEWVPLARFEWNANGSADRPSTGHWTDYAAENYGFDDAGTVTPNGNLSTFLEYNEFPMWTLVHNATSF